MCAAFVLKAVLHPITVLGTTTPTGPHWHALVIEVIVTFNMMFVTLAVATDTRAVSALTPRAVLFGFAAEWLIIPLTLTSSLVLCCRGCRWVSWPGWRLVPRFALRPSSQGK